MAEPSETDRNLLLELDRRYRLVLHSTDQIAGEILEVMLPEVKAKFDDIVERIDRLRKRSPQLFSVIDRMYREACSGERQNHNIWPKTGVPLPLPAWVPTEDLVDFAFEEDLLLSGDPQPDS